MFLPVPLSLCLRDGFTHPLHPLLAAMASARCASEAAVPAAMGIQPLWGLIGLMIFQHILPSGQLT